MADTLLAIYLDAKKRYQSMIPSFFVIGGQRCGTTWLHHFLVQHPDVFVLEEKEPDYFYRVALTEPFECYEALFEQGASAAARGDMSVNYCMLTIPVLEQIHRILPDLKIVFTIRNPVDRSWSQLKLIHDLINLRSEPLKDLSIRRLLLILGQQRVTRRSDFLGILNRWQSIYPKEAFHLSLFEDVKTKPEEYLKGVLGHIGVDFNKLPSELNLSETIYSGGSEDMPDSVRWWLCKKWLEPVKKLNRYLDGMVDHWIVDIERDLKELSPPSGWNPLLHSLQALPERVAYNLYDKRREKKLVSVLKRVPTKRA